MRPRKRPQISDDTRGRAEDAERCATDQRELEGERVRSEPLEDDDDFVTDAEIEARELRSGTEDDDDRR